MAADSYGCLDYLYCSKDSYLNLLSTDHTPFIIIFFEICADLAGLESANDSSMNRCFASVYKSLNIQRFIYFRFKQLENVITLSVGALSARIHHHQNQHTSPITIKRRHGKLMLFSVSYPNQSKGCFYLLSLMLNQRRIF